MFNCWLKFLSVGEGLAPPAFINLPPNLFQQVILSERSESNFWEVSGNIANPSKSEKCQDIFRDLQKDLVVLRVLMLHLIKLQIERDPSVVGEPLPRLFSPITVEKRFDAAAVSIVFPYLTNISPLRSG